jgi:tripartite-type tricarboxylate transporter receptor subunit TctC
MVRLYAPARTPASVVANANAPINAALKDKSVIDSLAVMGLVAQGSTPAEMDKSQKEENTPLGPARQEDRVHGGIVKSRARRPMSRMPATWKA